MNQNIQVFCDFQSNGISKIEVELLYGDAKYEYVFSKSDFHAFEIETQEEQPDFEYLYKAYLYGGGSVTSKKQSTRDRVLVISPGNKELGIIEGRIIYPIDLSESCSKVTVSIAANGQHTEFVRSGERLFQGKNIPIIDEFHLFLGRPSSGEYRYRVRYETFRGQVLETDWCESRSWQFVVPDPFQERRRIRFVGVFDGEVVVREFHVVLKQRDAHDYVVDIPISLLEGEDPKDLDVDIVDSDSVRLSYDGFVKMDDNTVQQIPDTEVTSSLIVLQANIAASGDMA